MSSSDSTTSTLDLTDVVSSADDTTTVAKAFYYVGKGISALITAGDDIVGLLG